MSKNTLLDKIWQAHTVRELENGVTHLFIGLHLVHEVTSPQAFDMLTERDLPVLFPECTHATADHIIPTTSLVRPFADPLAEEMMQTLIVNCEKFGIELILGEEKQGIVHIIGPEMGLTQPGMTIACGDSHTATHGAFGTVAFGVGTTQVANILATGCILEKKPKVRRIEINGKLAYGVYAKDVILYIIHKLGAAGGTGFAYEYAGDVISNMTMEERMTVCNMSVEGGAKLGYCLPDQKTVDYVRGRERAPTGEAFDRLAAWWLSLRSDDSAEYDEVIQINGEDIPPMITWGTNSGESMPIDAKIPEGANIKALAYMGFEAGQQVLGSPIHAAFLGSCTNGRIEDFREAARIIREYNLKVASGVRAIAVPGSAQVRKAVVAEGLHKVFIDAGFEWRSFGCSACLGMNPDTFGQKQRVVSSSNRNYEGRQGQEVRTMLMSPAGVVISAAMGHVADVRELTTTVV